MASSRQAAIRTIIGPRLSRCAGLEHLLATVLLMIAAGAPASADSPALTALIKPLDLVVYRLGTKPPEFLGLTPDSHSLSLSKLSGKVVVINFWASWCHECRPEMPVLETSSADQDWGTHGILGAISGHCRSARRPAGARLS